MKTILTLLVPFAFSILSALSQTITTTNAQGATIVEVITVDPVARTPVTSIIQTLAVTQTPTPSTPSIVTAATTAPDVQQGPVGQPAATNAQAPSTVYTYTTTNANGETIAVVDTFTPTFPASQAPVRITSGTILGYSQWLSAVGTNTVANGAVAHRWRSQKSLLPAALGVFTGLLGGAWIALI